MSDFFSERLCSSSGRPIVVAEVSTNHRGSLSEACALICAAARAGADAVKFQSYAALDLTLRSSRKEFMLEHPLWRGRSLFSLYSEGSLPLSWHERLWSEASRCGIAIFASVFSPERLALLESLIVSPAYKIASAELVDLELIGSVARTGRAVIISTGMGSHEEIERAVSAVRAAGNDRLVLLHCLSAYPAHSDAMNLRALTTLAREFGCAVGLSDHTRDADAARLAVALGASVIEKHFTLERREGDLDAAFSLTETEFSAFSRAIRDAWCAMGDGELEVGDSERASLPFRRSLYVVKAMREGDAFTGENIRSIRPSAGLAPYHYRRVLRACAACDISAGVPLEESMLDESRARVSSQQDSSR